MPTDAAASRNGACPCGSGRRFKHCCGANGRRDPGARYAALTAHRAGLLGRAESLYRQAIADDPADVDSLHMLGVVQLQRLRYGPALDLLAEAAERTGWAIADIRHNVGIVLGKLVTGEANVRQAALLAEFVALERARREARVVATPRVSVVLAAYNHARYIGEALDSVAAQTYRNVELVVIDDGSTEGTAAVIAERLARFPFPARFVSRDNRGAPASFNEAAALATGDYLAFLNSDDRFTPDRIATLVDEVALPGCAWGFSLVAAAAPHAAPRAELEGRDPILQRQRNFLGTQPNSFTFVEYNVAVSSGNLFVRRDFFAALGGFRAFRYNHDWDFCLRACALAEPAVAYRPLYEYRVHDANTISESREACNADADRVLRAFLAEALDARTPCTNPLGPHAPANRAVLLKIAFRAGLGRLMDVAALQRLTAERRAERAATPPPLARPVAPRRIAFVVLGMHRSGTSAVARVLNLCGAFLPERVKPPKIGVNEKGFWEPEAVLDLNVRVLQQVGGSWDRPVDIPADGEVVDEFVADAVQLLASEYEGRDTIVIKDPRMCLLAPLWDRALRAAGYDTAYVVPLRNPLEVAQSLQARGDMSVPQGVALWSAYMARVEAFAGQRDDVLYLRFDDLLDDWRGAIGRIARHFHAALAPDARAAEVDAFLERSLRRQEASLDTLDARCSEWRLPDVAPRFRALLRSCADLADAPARIDTAVAVPRVELPAPTAAFVLCIEGNGIRDQALLLCQSIRRFAGRHRNADILAFAPRPGLGVDRDTQRRLVELDVQYVDVPLNVRCPDYAPANRVFAGAYAEARTTADFLVVMDSDTVWLDEPELPREHDAAARPVDNKGSATGGPGDPFEAYWTRLAEIAGIPLDRLPMLDATIGRERIRASYNAGLAMARRDKGIFTRCAELFEASLAQDMRPYRNSGVNIFASTGHVGQAGSEYWGSSQAALALAMWSCTDRVLHLPDHYNVPLHLIAAEGDIDSRWLARPPVHVHYHWMFAPQHVEVGMEVLAWLRVPDDRIEWLAQRTPLGSAAATASSPRRPYAARSLDVAQLPGNA